MPSRKILLAVLAGLAGLTAAPARAGEEPFQLECADGFLLDGLIETPDDPAESKVEKVIVLLHGSGAQSMDADLTAVTRDGKQNLVFKEFSAALAQSGFGVVRYHKRSHQIQLEMQKDPAFKESAVLKATAMNPMKWFVDDAIACVHFVETRFPTAEIFLFGHSQGAYIALQVAGQVPSIRGVALVGFALGSTDLLLFEQTVYRPLGLFAKLDANGDGALAGEELESDDPIAASLRAQMLILDLDADSAISPTELQAGNLSNLLLRDMTASVRVQEATYPRPADILRDTPIKVAFFQGLLDNQTPAYNAKAVELVAKHIWRKTNFRFTFFPGLGHALDARADYDDLTYGTIDPEAKAKVVEELKSFF